jgi:Uma2 family endonuclease
MNGALQQSWTVEKFFAWAGHQEGRYEFDGEQPVAMTGGSNRHAIIMRDLHRALDRRLRGTPCQSLGPDAGIATIGNAIRYPDALVTCTKQIEEARTVEGVVIAFEIVSPTSVRTDHTLKVREYAAIVSMRRYIIIESAAPGLLVLHRQNSNDPWTALPLSAGDLLKLPELGMEMPVDELYDGLEFMEVQTAS